MNLYSINPIRMQTYLKKIVLYYIYWSWRLLAPPRYPNVGNLWLPKSTLTSQWALKAFHDLTPQFKFKSWISEQFTMLPHVSALTRMFSVCFFPILECERLQAEHFLFFTALYYTASLHAFVRVPALPHCTGQAGPAAFRVYTRPPLQTEKKKIYIYTKA